MKFNCYWSRIVFLNTNHL